jgi:fluoride exporter
VTLLMIAVGAALGAPARFLTDRLVQSWHPSAFPWGTVTVNVVASLLLGVVTGAAGELDPRVTALVASGFCGALSTYSTFAYETLRLGEEGARLAAAVNVALSVTAALGAAALGWELGATWS